MKKIDLSQITNKKADFEGTWDIMNPELGKYTLYITEKFPTTDSTSLEIPTLAEINVRGIIIDVAIGLNATFQGHLNESNFVFFKEYDDESKTKGAAQHGVLYSFSGSINSGKDIAGYFNGNKARSFSGGNTALIKTLT